MHVSRGAALPHHHWLATCPNFPISGCGHATRPKARATLPTQPLTTPAGTQPPSWPPHLPQWCRSCPAQAAAAGSRAGSAAGGRERRRRCPAPHLAACCPPAAVVGGLGGWMGAGWGPMMWLPEWWITSRSPNATPGMCIAGDMGIPARQATSCAWPPTHLHQSSRCVRAGQLLRPGASQPKHVF